MRRALKVRNENIWVKSFLCSVLFVYRWAYCSLFRMYGTPRFFPGTFSFRYWASNLVLAIGLDSIRGPLLRRTAIAVMVLTMSLQTLAFQQAPSRPPWSEVFHAAAQETGPFVRLHAYGHPLHHMSMVADHHFEADLAENRRAMVDGTRIVFYKSFDHLKLYMLDYYTAGNPASARSLDVIVTVNREAYAEVTDYLVRNEIRFREEVIPAHGPLHYLRIEGKAAGGN